MNEAVVSPVARDSAWRAKAAAIVAVFVGLAAGYPSSYGATATAFILPLTGEFGWGRTVPSLMFVASMSGIAIASLWLGKVIERYGEAAVAAVSGLFLAVVMALLSRLSGSAELAVILCFFAGALGAGTGVGLYVSILPKWFDRDLGRALGLSILGQSAGMTVMPALAARVIASDGWRDAYLLLAGVQLTLTLATALILWRLGRAKHSVDRGSVSLSSSGLLVGEAIRTRRFWLLVVTIFLATLATFGAAVHIFPVYADRGIAPGLLPAVAIALGVGTLLGRVASGILLDHFEARIVAAASFTIGAAALVWVALLESVSTPMSLYLPPALIGLALGAESDILAYMTRRFFGLRHYPAIYNRLLIGYYLGAIAGPLAMGWAFDKLGGSMYPMLGLAVSGGLAAVISGLLPSTRGLERTTTAE